MHSAAVLPLQYFLSFKYLFSNFPYTRNRFFQIFYMVFAALLLITSFKKKLDFYSLYDLLRIHKTFSYNLYFMLIFNASKLQYYGH